MSALARPEKAQVRLLSHPGEARLRKAFGLLKSWSSNGLVYRLMEEDIALPSRNAAYILIGAGTDAGLLIRSGNFGSYTYRLDDAWQRPEGQRPANGYVLRPNSAGVERKRREAERALPEAPPARAYAGPAFGTGPLVPSLGLRPGDDVDADGELLPCIGGRIAASIGRQFDAVFQVGE